MKRIKNILIKALAIAMSVTVILVNPSMNLTISAQAQGKFNGLTINRPSNTTINSNTKQQLSTPDLKNVKDQNIETLLAEGYVEDLSRRDEYSKTFTHPSTTEEKIIYYLSPIHSFINEVWEDISYEFTSPRKRSLNTSLSNSNDKREIKIDSNKIIADDDIELVSDNNQASLLDKVSLTHYGYIYKTQMSDNTLNLDFISQKGSRLAISDSGLQVNIYDENDALQGVISPRNISDGVNTYYENVGVDLSQENDIYRVSFSVPLALQETSKSFDIDVEVAITKKYTQSDVQLYGVRGGQIYRDHSYNVGSSWQDVNRVIIGNASYNNGAVLGCVSTNPCVSDDNRGILYFRNGKTLNDVIGQGRVVKSASFSIWNQTVSTALHPNGVKYGTFMLDTNKKFDVSNVNTVTYTNYMNYLNSSSTGVKGKGEVTVNTGSWNSVDFDITNIMQSWQNSGSHRAIEIRALSDGLGGNVKSSNVFYNHADTSVSSNRQPSITITTVKEEPISPNLPLNDSEFYVRPFTTNIRNTNVVRFGALGFDAAVAPGATLSVDVSDGGSSLFSSQSNALSGYRIFSQYTTDLGYQLVENAQIYYRLTSNVQIPSLFYNTNLKTNTLYTIKYKVSNANNGGLWKQSDTFIIYKANGYDRLERLLSFYGVSDKDQFMQDNNLSDSLLVAGNLLFIRNPKKNQTLSYQSQELSEDDKRMIDADLLGRNQHCEYGYEPINLNTGNFNYSNDDLGFIEGETPVTITRNYDSMRLGRDSVVGRNWSLSIDENLYFMASGNVEYQDSTGRIYTFIKQANGSYKMPYGSSFSLVKEKDYQLSYERDGGYYDKDSKPIKETYTVDYYKYTLRSAASSDVKTFNHNGRITNNQTKQGAFTYTYDAQENITKYTMPSGASFNFEYNAHGYLSSAIAPNGTRVNYIYDSNGNLTQFVDQLGFKISYRYDANNRMISYTERETDKDIVVNVYDESGRILKQTDALGNVVTFKYGNGFTEITDFNGNTEKVYIDSRGYTTKVVDASGKETHKSYDERGNLIKLTDTEGLVYVYEYNDRNLLVKETNPLGKTLILTYDSDNNIISKKDFDDSLTHFNYDNDGNMTSLVLPDGKTSTMSYRNGLMTSQTDVFGNKKVYEYTDGKVTKVTYLDGSTEIFEYDSLGFVTKEISRSGVVTSYTYDNRGLVTAKSVGNSVQTFVYDANGNPVVETDPNGNKTIYTYDAWSRIIKKENGLGVETYKYDADGNQIEVVNAVGQKQTNTYNETSQLVSSVGFNGIETTYQYDALGRVIEIESTDGKTIKKTYDALGQVIEEDVNGELNHNSYDEQGRLVSQIDPFGRVSSSVYDANGLLSESVDRYGVMTSYHYDSSRLLSKETLGKVTVYTYDIEGNLISEGLLDTKTSKNIYERGLLKVSHLENGLIQSYEYDNQARLIKVLLQDEIVKSYAYDPNGNLISETDAMGNTTHYEYDALNNKIKETSPLGHVKTFKYDAISRLVEETVYDSVNDGVYTHITRYNEQGLVSERENAMGLVTKYTYDSKLQLIQEETGEKKVTYEYDDRGLKVKETRNGIESTTIYDEFKRVVSEDDGKGFITSYEYDSHDRVIRDSNNRYLDNRYEYDQYGNRTSITDSRGNTETFEYDILGNITKHVDIYGNTVETVYNDLSQVVSIKGFRNQETSLFDNQGRVREILSNTSGVSILEYDKNSNVISITDALGGKVTFEYDAQNQVIKEIDALGNMTQYAYDARGNVIETTYPDGGVVQNKYDALSRLVLTVDALGFETITDYDEYGRVIKTTDALGNSTTTRYNINDQVIETVNALGHKIEMTYDANHNLKARKQANGLVETYEYDDKNNLIVTHKSDKLQEIYTYDDYGNKTSVSLSGIKDPVEMFHYDTYGRLETTTDALGNKKQVQRNQYGETIQETINETAITHYDYDEDGRVIFVRDIHGLETKFEYDVLGRVIKESNNLGAILETEYDLNGNIVVGIDERGRMSYEYDSMGRQVKTINRLGHVESKAYDLLGRLILETDVLGNDKTYVYDALGNITMETDALGNKIVRENDALGNIIKSQEEDGKVLSYTYDSNGDISTILVNNTIVKEISYDQFGNVIKVDNQDNFIDSYDYDIYGNLITKKESGITTKLTYDDRMQLVTSKSGTLLTEYEYDALGQMIAIQSEQGSINITYDDRGNIETTTDVFGKITRYQTDIRGYQTEVIYPSGKKVSKVFDTYGRLSSLTTDGATTTYIYDAMDNILSEDDDQAISTYSYNQLGQIQTHVSTLKSDSRQLINTQYQYNGVGLLEVETNKLKDTSKTYVYDSNYQVIQLEIHSKDEVLESINYEYDVKGNRTQETKVNKEGSVVTRFVTNSANQLTDMLVESGKQIHYTYDKHGNVTNKRYNSGFEINYEYNDLNQLVSLKDSDSREILYRYDGLGNRIEKTETYDVHRVLSNQDPLKQEKVESVDVETLIRNAKEAYMASLESEKLCMMSEINTTQVTYTDTYTNDLSMENPVSIETYRNDTLLHTVVPQMMSLKHEVNDKKTLALQNVKQDSVVSVDIEGLVQEYDYDFFGRTQQIGAPILGYSGETHEGSLQYLRARYYDTETGVFISRDTYGGNAYDSGSQNRYIYAQNSNVNAIDPNGHFWGFVTNAVKKVVTKVVDVAKKVTNKVVASIPKPIKTVVSNIWQKAVTTTKKVLTTPTPVKSNPVKAVQYNRNPSITKPSVPKKAIPTPQQVKKTVNTVTMSLQQKLSVQESQWKKDGLKPHEIDTKRLEFVKAYCDTLGLGSVESSAILAQYRSIENKTKLAQGITDTAKNLLNFYDQISKKVGEKVTSLRDAGKAILDESVKVGKQVVDNVVEVAKTVGEVITNTAMIVMDTVSSVINTIGWFILKYKNEILAALTAIGIVSAFLLFPPAGVTLAIPLGTSIAGGTAVIASTTITVSSTVITSLVSVASGLVVYMALGGPTPDSGSDKGTGSLNSNGLPENDKITGYTKHGTEQALGRDGGIGVSNDAILDAVNNPVEILNEMGDLGPTVKYIGEKATVILNEIGKVITTWANGSGGVRP